MCIKLRLLNDQSCSERHNNYIELSAGDITVHGQKFEFEFAKGEEATSWDNLMSERNREFCEQKF